MLQEEDKTFLELAVMYKEEGNEWMKKKAPKDMREAFSCYSVGIDKGEKALEDRVADLGEIYPVMSTLYANRALCSLNLKNYRVAYEDSTKSLQFNSANVKAHYRKCKALLGSKHYEDCITACDDALKIDPENGELVKLKEQAAVEIERRERVRAEKRAEREALRAQLDVSWELAAQRRATLGFPRPSHPEQFQNKIYPTYQQALTEDERGNEIEITADFWPMLCLYPQHNQIDVLHTVPADELLVMVLSQMFSEPGDGELPSWDTHKEFYLSKLVVYIPISQNEACSDQAAWTDRMCTSILRDGGKKDIHAPVPSFGSVSWAEVHVGCTVAQLLAVPKHILDGGLLTLTIFVRCVYLHPVLLFVLLTSVLCVGVTLHILHS